MSLIERVGVLVAIVLGLALTELAIGFHRLMRAGRRVRWDWMSPALGLVMLLEAVQFWWVSQGWYANATELRLIEFLPRLIVLVMIYLLAAAVLPDEVPEQGLDLRAFYLDSSRYFWALVVLLTILIMFVLLPPADAPDYASRLQRHLILDGIALAIAIPATFLRNIRVQQTAVIALAALTSWVYIASARAFH